MKREKGYGNVDKEDVKKRGRRRRQEEGRDGGRKEGRKKRRKEDTDKLLFTLQNLS